MAILLPCLSIVATPVSRAQPDPNPDATREWLDQLPVWHSDQLGFDYQLAPYMQLQHGALAARVASAPEANSAATRIRRNDTGELVTLEPGDVIVAMDVMAFFNRADFDAHVGETSIYFRDCRSGRFIVGTTSLPPMIAPSRFIRGDKEQDPAITPSWWDEQASTPFPRNQAELRGLLLQSIRDKEVQLHTPRVRQPDGTLERAWLLYGSFSGPVHETVVEQALVESLRFDLGDPVFNQAMAAALPNVERLIDRELALLNQKRAEQIASERLDQQVEFQYLYAVFSAAAARGLPIPPFSALFLPAPQAPTFFVKLLSRRNATEILYMPRLNWWIITRSQHRQPQAPEWMSCKPGEEVGMIGYYAYTARYADGSADAPREDLHITRNGERILP